MANDYIEASRLLIACGSEIDVAEAEGNTPLHKATQKNFIEMIELLRSFGANPWTRNKAVRDLSCALLRFLSPRHHKCALTRLTVFLFRFVLVGRARRRSTLRARRTSKRRCRR